MILNLLNSYLKKNMAILIDKSLVLFGGAGLLPEVSKSILSLFKGVAKHHPSLFKGCFDIIKPHVGGLRDLESFKILVSAIKEYNPNSAVPESDSSCDCFSIASSHSLK